MHHSSRVVVPTWQLHQTIEGEYEEADLIETGVSIALAPIRLVADECVEWLRETRKPTRQEHSRKPSSVPAIRSEMRAQLRRLRDQA